MEQKLLGSTVIKRIKLYDNSRISDLRKCPRYFLLRHVYDFAPERKSMPLIYGSAWHAAMDIIWANYAAPQKEFDRVVEEAYEAFLVEWQKNGLDHPDNISPDELDEMAPRTPQVAKEMLYHYLDERQHIMKDKSFELVDIERPFAVPLSPTDNSMFYVGRLDKIIKFRKQTLVLEHKSSTSYKKGGPFRNDFLDSFSPNSQVDGYNFALHSMFGDEATAVWVDGALVHRTVHDGFVLIPIDRQFAMLEAWLWETHYWIDQIEANKVILAERSQQDTKYLAAFPKNTGSCGNFGGCPFLDLCKSYPNPAKLEGKPPLGYIKSHWSPWDTIKLEKIGLSADGTD